MKRCIELTAALSVATIIFTPQLTADIYRWDTWDVISGTEGIRPGPGVDLSGLNLSHARLWRDLSEANLSRADLTRAHVGGTTLSGVDFRDANLTEVQFGNSATVSGADFSGAVIDGASFTTSNGFTAEQLYSTASYQLGDLSGIGLAGSDLTGWNLAGKDLAGASLAGSTLSNADFTGANFSGADLRDAENFIGTNLADVRNMIWPSGEVLGLDLSTNRSRFVVRDHELPVSVSDAFVMGEDSQLRLILSDAEWGSTIQLAEGLIPKLGSTLVIEHSPGADVFRQTIDLFDWSIDLDAANVFDRIELPTGCKSTSAASTSRARSFRWRCLDRRLPVATRIRTLTWTS